MSPSNDGIAPLTIGFHFATHVHSSAAYQAPRRWCYFFPRQDAIPYPRPHACTLQQLVQWRDGNGSFSLPRTILPKLPSNLPNDSKHSTPPTVVTQLGQVYCYQSTRYSVFLSVLRVGDCQRTSPPSKSGQTVFVTAPLLACPFQLDLTTVHKIISGASKRGKSTAHYHLG
jgi:hypothetical protein